MICIEFLIGIIAIVSNDDVVGIGKNAVIVCSYVFSDGPGVGSVENQFIAFCWWVDKILLLWVWSILGLIVCV